MHIQDQQRHQKAKITTLKLHSFLFAAHPCSLPVPIFRLLLLNLKTGQIAHAKATTIRIYCK